MRLPGTEQAMGLLPWMSGMALATTVVITASVQAATLNNWQFDPATQQLVITLPKGVTPQYHLAAEPARIVVDLPNTEVGTVPMQQVYSGAVRQIRIAQFQPGLARIVLELAPEAVLAPGQVELQQLDGSDDTTQRWALRPLLVTDTPNPTVAQAPVSSTATNPVNPSATIPQFNAPAPVASAPAAVSVPSAPNPAPTNSVETAQPVAPPADVATASSSDDSNDNALPPLEPGAVEIPVQIEPSTTTPTPEPETASEPEVAPAESTTVAETPAPAIATAPELPIPLSLPGSAPINPAPANSVPVSPAPTAAVSAPLPVDFSRPPELATGTAAALALPSVGQAAINTPTAPAPSSGTLSFPRPTASGVSVPPINTVVAENPTVAENSIAENPAENSPENSATNSSVANPTPQPDAEPPRANQPVDSQPSADQFPQPAAASSTPSASPATPAIPPAQPIPAQPASTAPTVPPSNSEIPFGQPLATSPSAPATSAPTSPGPVGNTAPTSPVPANDAIPFGQPIPTTTPSAPATPEIPVIPFGQPLPVPQSSINSLPGTINESAAVVPSGTVLKLRYAGESALSLAEQASRQEVLLLEQSVHDQAGNLVFPAGSPVIGRFETSETGSQFVAQAVQVQGQNIALNAQSEPLAGERQIRQSGLLRNSAIGAVAGTLLGAVTGVGLIPAVIAGAATSAATTYVTSPEAAAVIQPNQVIEVKLMQNLVSRAVQ